MSRFRWLLAAVVVLGLGAGAAATAFYLTFVRDLPSFESLADYRPPLTSTVYDRHGRPAGEFYEFRRRLTPLEDVPEVVIQAFLAAEDDNFYQHEGVDYVSIVRAAVANLMAGGETVQGASTITQQMVKQLLLSPEQTYRRKIRELILAGRIEDRFSKDEILYLYLNQIYFGAGAYGIGEAARTYFDKPIRDVDASEAAMLAGLPKAPGRNSPYLNPTRAEERRRYVLDRMLEEGFLDATAHREASEDPPTLSSGETSPAFQAASYFTEEIRRVLVEALGNETVLTGGLRIETTLDLDLQQAAVASVRGGIEALDRRRGYRGPIRRIGAAPQEDELTRLAEENQLVAPDEGLAPLPAPGDRGLAVLLEVEETQATAAMAPHVRVRLDLADLGWARDPEAPRGAIKDLRTRFEVGDVIPVEISAEPAGEAADDDGRADASPAEPPLAARVAGGTVMLAARVAGGTVMLAARVAGGTVMLPATLAQVPEAQGALLSFDVGSGDVLAMVGGYDFEDSEFNRTTQALRQPGSAFKPIVYAAAMDRGYTPASIVVDRPVVIETAGFTWRPENYGRRFLGPLVIGEALARSVNNATVHLLRDVGIDHVMEFSRRVGIDSPLERNLGLALGVNPVTLLEITRAYGIFAGGGKRVAPTILRRVLDREGNELLGPVLLGGGELPRHGDLAEPPPPPISRDAVERDSHEVPLPAGHAISPQQAFLATAVLRQVIDHPRGTGRRAAALGHPLAGKTGTTNDQADAWFVGYSPDVATGVWVGFDEKRVLGRGETGGRAALPIWIEYMKAALADRPVREFPVPPGIVFARIDPKTGLLADAGSGDALFQPFFEGTAPTERTSQAATGSRDRLRLDF